MPLVTLKILCFSGKKGVNFCHPKFSTFSILQNFRLLISFFQFAYFQPLILSGIAISFFSVKTLRIVAIKNLICPVSPKN